MVGVDKKIRWLLSVGLTLLIVALAASILAKRVEAGDTVRVEYKLTLDDGTVYYSTQTNEPLRVKLGQGVLLSSLEEVLIGMHAGETKTLSIPYERAYGPYRPELVQVLDRRRLPDGVQPVIGEAWDAELKDGSHRSVVILETSETTVTVDANHPLAGENLNFEIKLVSIEGSGAPDESAKWILGGTLLAVGIGEVGLLFLDNRTRRRTVSTSRPRLARRTLSTNYRKR